MVDVKSSPRLGHDNRTKPQATLGEAARHQAELHMAPCLSRGPATPTPRPPRPPMGAAPQASPSLAPAPHPPVTASQLPSPHRPSATPQPNPSTPAQRLLTWRGRGSAHGGGGSPPTRGVLRRGASNAGGSSDGRGSHGASSLRGHYLGGCGQRNGEGTGRLSGCRRTANGRSGRGP